MRVGQGPKHVPDLPMLRARIRDVIATFTPDVLYKT
jgi:hypothetical protein